MRKIRFFLTAGGRRFLLGLFSMALILGPMVALSSAAEAAEKTPQKQPVFCVEKKNKIGDKITIGYFGDRAAAMAKMANEDPSKEPGACTVHEAINQSAAGFIVLDAQNNVVPGSPPAGAMCTNGTSVCDAAGSVCQRLPVVKKCRNVWWQPASGTVGDCGCACLP